MINQDRVYSRLIEALEKTGHDIWLNKMKEIQRDRIHIALMVEPYLTMILQGKKTIESRFSQKRISPYNRVSCGDIVVLKRSGGGYVGVFEVGKVIFYEITDRKQIENIKAEYNDRLCIEDSFWDAKADSRFATLMEVRDLCIFDEFYIKDANRKSWVDFSAKEAQIESPSRQHIICISGKSGSGKTTVAKKLSELMGGVYVTVSDYLRTLCVSDKPSREDLQVIGNECISEGWDSFVHSFVSYASWKGDRPLIIDGVRHTEFMNILCAELYPNRPISVYLDASPNTIMEHIARRGYERVDPKPLSEGFNDRIRNHSDFCVCVDGESVESICNKILTHLHGSKVDTGDYNTEVSVLREHINGFNVRRRWKKFHNPRSLAISISIEASELLELYQWNGNAKSDELVEEELADVLIYCINLANILKLDITDIILSKLKKNAEKYPEK